MIKERLDKLINFIEKNNFFAITVYFILLYCLLAVIFGFAYYISVKYYSFIIYTPFSPLNISLSDCIFYSFISQLKASYNFYKVIGFGRFLVVFQGVLSIILSGIWIGIAIIKLTLPNKKSITFCEYAFYNIKENKFVIIFVNINRQKLVNCDLSIMPRFCKYNYVGYGYKLPYIGRSVWFFSTKKYRLDRLKSYYKNHSLDDKDGVKAGISGNYGFSKYANFKKYKLDKIKVIKNKIFARNPIYEEPALDEPFWDSFNNPVPKAPLLLEYLERNILNK
jgi:hypothetical protein